MQNEEMDTIEINVSEYYDGNKYYRFMPQSIFNALEAAFLEGKGTAIVPKSEFEAMLNDFYDEKSQTINRNCKRVKLPLL
ncbi:MAG: hypothetical protein FWF53_07185 [Candidatus Azobacteroides sp.]|nr:hypothetical protein [Candidatus Azobacteroides sp.]